MVELLISFVISLESKSFDYHMPTCTIIQDDFNIFPRTYFLNREINIDKAILLFNLRNVVKNKIYFLLLR